MVCPPQIDFCATYYFGGRGP